MRKGIFGPAVVKAVDTGSPAMDAGVRPGDKILRIDRESLRDLIDFHLLLMDEVPHLLEIERSETIRTALLESNGKPTGIQLEQPVFGKVMTCNNACFFCFIDQLPAGLRKTMYVKDDDYRLSFLAGNFITLTNLGERDISRIIDERLSPLYVSLHATDTGLRRKLFGNPHAEIGLDTLGAILDAGIEVHVQIVLLKGINDGEMLDRTLSDVMSRFPRVASVGVVPVGVTTTGGKRLPLSYVQTAESAVRLLEQLNGWRKTMKGRGPFAADEFFYKSGERLPPRRYYEEYPQLENGIGLARKLIDEFEEAISSSPEPENNNGLILVTSPMGAWVLDGLHLDKYGVSTVVCRNTLFGETVNVCGLMPGVDVVRSIKGTARAETALIPDVALRDGAFIDGETTDGISESCGVKAVPVNVDGRCLADAIVKRKGA